MGCLSLLRLGHVSHSVVHDQNCVLFPQDIDSSKDLGACCGGGTVGLGVGDQLQCGRDCGWDAGEDIVNKSCINDCTMMRKVDDEDGVKCS
eukprot:5712233-Ditylum_brightwellii.AAC.1